MPRIAWLLVCVAATGCTRDAVEPAVANAPVFSAQAGTASCPASPDIVVSTEAELRAAVATAPAGSTIAISGMIALTSGIIYIDRSDLHLTCAAPGAGLEIGLPSAVQRLIRIEAPRVSVTGLRLDGHLITLENSSTVVVRSISQVAEDVTLADNDITCGASTCVVLNGTPRATIARNRMAPAAGSGNDYTFFAQSQTQYLPTVSEDVTLADNDMTCGAISCALLVGTPRAVIARNRMAPATGSGVEYTFQLASQPGAPAEDVTLADNDMTCGTYLCAFLSGTPRAVIVRNRMAPAVGVATIHDDIYVQNYADDQLTVISDGVTLADNILSCGLHSCATFAGSPHANITGNRMAPPASGTTQHDVVVTAAASALPENVTLADNIMACGSSTCAQLLGTPRAMIARNHMAPAAGVASLRTILVQASVVGGVTVGAEDVTFADNELECGPGASCTLFAGTPRAVIVRNHLAASGPSSGIHVQAYTSGSGVSVDGTRVAQNTVTTTDRSTDVRFGGIRVRDGSGIIVTDNIVTGPWANSISLTALLGGEVARNDLRGAYQYGIAAGTNVASIPPSLISVDGIAVRTNRIMGAVLAGVGVQYTCRSVLVGNNLSGNVASAVFFLESGANTFVGNGTTVIDDGAMDCNGDGKLDPNVISGVKRVQKGQPFGTVIGGTGSGAVSDLR